MKNEKYTALIVLNSDILSLLEKWKYGVSVESLVKTHEFKCVFADKLTIIPERFIKNHCVLKRINNIENNIKKSTRFISKILKKIPNVKRRKTLSVLASKTPKHKMFLKRIRKRLSSKKYNKMQISIKAILT